MKKESVLKTAFQTAVSILAGVTGGNHAYGQQAGAQAYEYLAARRGK